ALLEAARLLAQRGALQRLQVLPELRAVEALDRLLVSTTDRARELRCDVDRRTVAPGCVGGAPDVLHATGDLLGREHRRHPALAVFAGASPHLGVVAAGVHRQRRLPRLGKALHVLKPHVVAAEARLALGEEQAQPSHALVDDLSPAGLTGVGIERFVLFAVGARADAE